MKKFFFLLVITSTVSVAQQNGVYFMQSAEDFFLLGMRQYAQKDFKAADASFQSAIAVSPLSHRITASMIMLAKTHYALKDYIGTAAVCDSFIVNYPYSMYIEDAHFTLGMCYYSEGLYVKTVEEMETVYRTARQRLNKEHAFKVMDNVASEFLSAGELGTLVETDLGDTIHALLTVISAEKYFAQGDNDRAKALLQGFSDPLQDKSLQQRANKLLSRIDRGNLVKVGVLLPLFSETTSGPGVRDKRVANEVLEGIRLALGDYEEQSEPGHISIELDIEDSRRDSTTIDEIITKWRGDSSVSAILGPIFSDETFHAAAVAESCHIPIISPTATEEGISQIGPYVFQANTSISMRGKVMAEYAVNVLGARTLGILASNFPSSATQADSFAAEAARLGGNVIMDRRYERGETDLRFPLREFRTVASTMEPNYTVNLKGRMNVGNVSRILVSFGADAQVVDSLLAVSGTVDLTKLYGSRAKAVADSLHLPVLISYPYVDSLQYPVNTIDAIFCPISSSQQIGVISSQVAYFNLKTTVLGTAEWYNIHELEMNRRYADGVIFGSDRWIEQNQRTKEVYGEYFQKYGKQISDNVLYGYDAMSLLADRIRTGVITRDELAASLASVVNFRGIRNSITLVNNRVNSTLHILQYKNGTISKLITYSFQ